MMKHFANRIFLLSVCMLFLLHEAKSQDKTGNKDRKHTMYKDEKGKEQRCGIVSLDTLEQVSPYKAWFHDGYSSFTLQSNTYSLKEKLNDVTVDVYFGTWCSDSQFWVPRFVKLWDELALDRKKIKFIALYNLKEKIKQGPYHEEKGKDIHHVPTFIFKRKGQEIARIVESPNNDLETDVGQIAHGYPSQPNYRVASFLINLLKAHRPQNIENNQEKYLKQIKNKPQGYGELESLGKVYLVSDRVAEALVVFRFNIHFFKYNPRVYLSYADGLARAGKIKEAKKYYQKTLTMDSNNKIAKAQLKKL